MTGFFLKKKKKCLKMKLIFENNLKTTKEYVSKRGFSEKK
jgi:hypothetical protein